MSPGEKLYVDGYISWPDSGVSIAVHDHLRYGFAMANFSCGSKVNVLTAGLELAANTEGIASNLGGREGGILKRIELW